MADKWMQDAADKMKENGTEGSYGHHSIKQMNKDIKKGGKIAKKANFAKNARKANHKK